MLTLAVSLITSPVTWAAVCRSGPLSADGGTRADVWSRSVFLSAVNSLFRDEPAQCGSSLSLSSLHRRVCPPSITSFSHPLSLSLSLSQAWISPTGCFPFNPSLPPPPSSCLLSAGCFHGNITFNCLQWALTFQFRWGGGWKWVESFLFFLLLLSVGRLPFLRWFVWCDSCCVCFHLSAAGNPPETCEPNVHVVVVVQLRSRSVLYVFFFLELVVNSRRCFYIIIILWWDEKSVL